MASSRAERGAVAGRRNDQVMQLGEMRRTRPSSSSVAEIRHWPPSNPPALWARKRRSRKVEMGPCRSAAAGSRSPAPTAGAKGLHRPRPDRRPCSSAGPEVVGRRGSWVGRDCRRAARSASPRRAGGSRDPSLASFVPPGGGPHQEGHVAASLPAQAARRNSRPMAPAADDQDAHVPSSAAQARQRTWFINDDRQSN